MHITLKKKPQAQPQPAEQIETTEQAQQAAPAQPAANPHGLTVIHTGAEHTAEQPQPIQGVETRQLVPVMFKEGYTKDVRLEAKLVGEFIMADAHRNIFKALAICAQLENQRRARQAANQIGNTIATEDRVEFAKTTLAALTAMRSNMRGLGIAAFQTYSNKRTNRILLTAYFKNLRKAFYEIDVAMSSVNYRANSWAKHIFNESFFRITGCARPRETNHPTACLWSTKPAPVKATTPDKNWSLTVDAKEFAKIVKGVALAADPRSNIPVLQNALFTFDGSTATISAYDHRIGIRATLDGKATGEPFDISVNPRRLLDALKKHKSGYVDIGARGGEDRDSDFFVAGQKLTSMPAADAPPWPAIGLCQSLYADSDRLTTALTRAWIATNPDDPRAFMGGVLMCNDAFVGTDGHRLTAIQNDIADMAFQCIVPSRTVSVLSKLTPSTKKGERRVTKVMVPTTINDKPNAISFQVDCFEMVSRVVDANYPSYSKVLPDTSSGAWRCIFNTARFRAEVAAAREFACAKENMDIIDITFDKEAGTARFHAETHDVGTYDNTIECEIDRHLDGSADSKPLKLSFNARYLLEATHNRSESETILFVRGELSGAAFTFTTDALFETHVVMPIKI